MFLELPSNPSFLAMDSSCMTWELCVIGGVVVGCWFVFQRHPVGIVIPIIVSLLYGIAEYYVESFKGSMITPSDLRSAGTGLNVAGGYEYQLTPTLLFLIAMFALAAAALVWLRDPLGRVISHEGFVAKSQYGKHVTSDGASSSEADKTKRSNRSNSWLIRNIVSTAISLILGISLIVIPVSIAANREWKKVFSGFDVFEMSSSADNYGLIPSFIYFAQLENFEMPAGYERGKAAELQAKLAGLYDRYVDNTDAHHAAVDQFMGALPNVVLVMNESFPISPHTMGSMRSMKALRM